MMKQVQFIDAYWRMHVLVSCAQCLDCIQTYLTYMQIRATSYMGMRSASFSYKSRLKSDFFQRFECTE